ncbi:MAG: pyrimidine-nucleoside phosphorylase [Gaiellales bacterium]|nr:pyrimidine-nucleoside phosphorylase [Gaiellales bacterium]
MTESVPDLIARKRDGGELDEAEIAALIDPDVPDYQLSAFLMAVVLRGMSEAETRALLEAMLASGERVSWPWPVADKHSTGGVGDKTTVVLAPLLAASGALVAKMSGRGLGHTGGTLDKLESIPGMRVSLSLAGMRRQVEQVGIAVAGQTAELAPADGRLYALRDATATVPSLPLIATSIMSKKIASGSTRLLLDVKVGEGAFMPDRDSARELAALMVRLGAEHGTRATAMLSGMDEPLGRAVGNALEVEEAVATLRGEGPADLRELCLHAAGVLLGDRPAAERALASGAAYEAYERWIRAQRGDPDAPLPKAPAVVDVPAQRSGIVQHCHALAVGRAAMRLGAGRVAKGDPIDHAVGIVVHAKRGDPVEAGQPLATVHARAEFDQAQIEACFEIADAPAQPEPLILEELAEDA